MDARVWYACAPRSSSSTLCRQPAERAEQKPQGDRLQAFLRRCRLAPVRPDLRIAGILSDPHRDRAAGAPCAEIAALMGEAWRSWSSARVRCARCASCWRPPIPAPIPLLDISGGYLQDRGAQPCRRSIRTFRCARWSPTSPLPITLAALPQQPRRAGFFPGSTIGNFKPDAAMALLRRMRASLNGGGLLVGVDLVKDPARLHAAYNDAARCHRFVQQELCWRAPTANWTPISIWRLSRTMRPTTRTPIASRCIWSARSASACTIAEREAFDFAPGEAVHTEDSHKYTIESFREMAARAGFRPRAVWTDAERLFAIHWLES